VTPTLVDARSGTTRWTGAPQVVTPVDPFSAQGEIATDVAQALEVQLRPVDRAGLAHRMTGHPEAFAAYVRGMAAFDAARAVSSSGVADWSDVVRHRQRAAAEFARAVALDSTFGEAWALLAQMEAVIANLSSSDPAKAAAAARARAALARALAHAPDRPRTLLVLSHVRSTLDGDTTGQDTLVARALARGGNDPEVLIWVSQHRVRQGRPDEAHALTRRAAALDPRSAFYLDQVVQSALRSRRWDEARRAADALIALDSADPRGWARRFAQATLRGDTLEIQRLMPQALATVPRPEHRLLQYMPLAGPAYARRYLGLSAGELNVRSLADSAQYYDNKASTLLHLGDRARARVYYDSVRTVLAGLSPRHGPFRSLVQMRAAAEAMAGDTAAARRSLAAILAAAPPGAGPSTHLGGLLDPVRAATVYARLGEPETAVRWLAAGLGRPWSARGYALMPELRILRGRPAFERLLREHPE
jgi:tetratricopeptide (TPR) repeat protein